MIFLAIYLVLALVVGYGYFALISSTDTWVGDKQDYGTVIFTGLVWPIFVTYAVIFTLRNRGK